jgi:hypothetical protein
VGVVTTYKLTNRRNRCNCCSCCHRCHSCHRRNQADLVTPAELDEAEALLRTLHPRVKIHRCTLCKVLVSEIRTRIPKIRTPYS